MAPPPPLPTIAQPPRLPPIVQVAGLTKLAHFGSYGVPQLVFGLLAGALFALSGGLGPAILAHAMHNGVVLLMGPGT